MEIYKISCDTCGSDLNTPSSYPGYYLILSCGALPLTNIVNAVLVYPPIDKDCHFCSKECMSSFKFPNRFNGEDE